MYKLQNSLCLILVLLLCITSKVHAAKTCATTINELRAILADQNLPLNWKEITMNDGKPLQVSILKKGEQIYLEFTKSDAGLWAESASLICKEGSHIEARFTGEQIRFGPAAPWLLQQLLGNGGTFTLTMINEGKLQIKTRGWSGDFIPE